MIASTSKQTIEYQQEQQMAFESYSRFPLRQEVKSRSRSPVIEQPRLRPSSPHVQEPDYEEPQGEEPSLDQPQFEDAAYEHDDTILDEEVGEREAVIQEPEPNSSPPRSPAASIHRKSSSVELHIEEHRPLSPEQTKSKSPSPPPRSPSVDLHPEAHRPFSPENLAVPSPRHRSHSPQLEVPLRSARTPSIEPSERPSSIEVPLSAKISARRSPTPFLTRLTSAPPDSPAPKDSLEPPMKAPRFSLSPSPVIRSALSPSPAIVQRSVSPYAGVKEALALEKGKGVEKRPMDLFPDQANGRSLSPRIAAERPFNHLTTTQASPVPVNLFPSTQTRSPAQHSPAIFQEELGDTIKVIDGFETTLPLYKSSTDCESAVFLAATSVRLCLRSTALAIHYHGRSVAMPRMSC